MLRAVAETASTNDAVMALARAAEPEGVWLRADVQTGGRGRMGRVWQSPPGNLYASTLVRPRPGDPPAPTLALVAAVALEELVSRHLGPGRAMLKWPNDLLVGASGGAARKLSGILLEGGAGAVVIGFGVNLAHHPEGLERPATSLAGEGATPPSPDDFLAALAETFAHWLGLWRTQGLDPVRARWLERATPLGTPLVATAADGSAVKGLFDGLDVNGALRLRLEDGRCDIIHAGDVFLL